MPEPFPSRLGSVDEPMGRPDNTPKTGADVVIIGAGPAGLPAAYELARRGQVFTILEADDQVGGISRSVERDGWRFDIGGHRFFTPLEKVIDAYAEVEQRHTLGKVVLIP